MTSKDITKALESYYENAEFTVPNIYFFKDGYQETDFLVISKNGYIADCEIKISRADFKADFKKITKHQILKEAPLLHKNKITDCSERLVKKFYFGWKESKNDDLVKNLKSIISGLEKKLEQSRKEKIDLQIQNRDLYRQLTEEKRKSPKELV